MYQSLQACRGAAAVLVLLFHLGRILAADKYFAARAFARPFDFGDSGVDFFFVLSGFIILLVHGRDFGQPRRLGAYLRKRCLRIYPTYWAAFAAVCLAALLSTSLRQSLLPPDLATLLKSLLLLPQDPAVVGGTGAPVIGVAWSLQYEMAFYAFIACCILSRALGLIVAGLFLIAFAYCSFSGGCGFPASFFHNNRVLLFALGMGIASLMPMRLRRPVTLAALGAAAFLAVGLLEVVSGSPPELFDRVLLYGVFGGVVILGLVAAEDQGAIRTWPWARQLGDASYILYLIHFPMLSLFCKLGVALGLHGYSGAAVTFVMSLAGCISAAVLLHRQVERPALKFLGRLAAGKPSGPIGMGAGTGR
jgi:peptidoglycan/LPS O-acetylase OafA/YrhL